MADMELVINISEETYKSIKHGMKFKDDVEAIMVQIENGTPLPKVHEWIPVSERLPEKNMACLVAVGKFNLTQIAMYSDLMGIVNHRIFYQGDYGDANFENITQYVNAWMPLPQSYKEGSDG